MKLPENLQKEHKEILAKFNSIQYDWKKYADQIIPEDKEYAKKIIAFLIKSIEYIEKNYESLEIKEWQEFLANYYNNFYYGSMGDDRNYLDFDESLDGEPLREFFWELRDEEIPLTKTKLRIIKRKLKALLKEF